MINAQMSGNYANAGFEKEVSDEIAKRSQKTARGFFVPRGSLEKRFISWD